MADDERTEPQTEKIGHIPKDVALRTLPKWQDYVTKSRELSTLREAVEVMKDEVRDHLRRTLKRDDNVDFSVEKDDSVRVFKRFTERVSKRGKGDDLSSYFQKGR